LRVTLVTNSKSGGGAERSMNLLANSLQTCEISTSIFPLTDGVADLVETVEETIEPIFGVEKSLRSLIKGILRFRSEIYNQKTDVAILNCDLPELLGLFLPRKIKLVIVEHARHPWGGRRILGVLVRLAHLSRRTTFVAVSTHLRIWPLQFKYRAVLPNMINGNTESIKKIEITEIRRLVFIGRLSKIKRPNVFIQICKNLKLPGLILGVGPMQAELKSKISRHRLDIEFLGYKKNPWEFLSKGDLVEAIQKGFPLLMSDIKDFRRFGFQSDLLCANVKEFTARIKAASVDERPIYISEDITRQILQTRNKTFITQEWERFLKKFM
jgi:glycosyltransferase involved in cell wall biosynthesis